MALHLTRITIRHLAFSVQAGFYRLWKQKFFYRVLNLQLQEGDMDYAVCMDNVKLCKPGTHTALQHGESHERSLGYASQGKHGG